MTKVHSLLVVCALCTSSARIQHLQIVNDTRLAFAIETFALADRGSLKLKASDVSVLGDVEPYTFGFVLFPTPAERNVDLLIAKLAEGQVCIFRKEEAADFGMTWLLPTYTNEWKRRDRMRHDISITIDETESYCLLFAHCMAPGTKVSFSLDYSFTNPGGHYLSAGEIFLPLVYHVLAGLCVLTLCVWEVFCYFRQAHVQKIHHLMTVFLLAQLIFFIVEGVMYHSIDETGLTSAWNTVSHILIFVRSVLQIVVLSLIIVGWSFLKPYLSMWERRIIFITGSIQVHNSRQA
jgi:hypothetical protein